MGESDYYNDKDSPVFGVHYIRWRCIIYPKHVDKELADLMAEASCTEMSLGFESANPKILKMLNKQFTPGAIQQTSDRLAEAGINRMGFSAAGRSGRNPRHG